MTTGAATVEHTAGAHTPHADATAYLDEPKKLLDRKVQGGVFVLFWLIALALWFTAPWITDPRLGAFLIDTGIVFASVGFAAPGISTVKGFGVTLGFAALALGLFALGDMGEILVISYFLRMLVPFLALLTTIYTAVGKVKVWYN